MPTRHHRPSSRLKRPLVSLGALALTWGALTVLTTAAVTPAAATAATSAPVTALRIGTWNTDLQPWLPGQAKVIDTIAATDLDVLGLQGVWTETAKDAILADPRTQAKYPYSYYPPAAQQAGFCSPEVVPIDQQGDFIGSILESGGDTREYEQPTVELTDPPALELVIALESQTCVSSLINTMQGFAEGQAPFDAIDLNASFRGDHYAHGGSPGQLILSSRPLDDVTVTAFDSDRIRRVNTYATVAGVRIAFSEWPRNILANFDPGYAPRQVGDLQEDTAADVIAEAPDVLVGTLNTSPDYQPGGYDALVRAGFTPTFDQPTYCPSPSHDAFAPCQLRQGYNLGVPASIELDNILANGSTRCQAPAVFATDPASDHIGLAATCDVDTTPVAQRDRYDVVGGATLSVPAPGVLGNDLESPDPRVTATLGTGPQQAQSFTLNPDGSFTYVPVSGFLGTDSFTYTARLGALVSDPATATITVADGPPAAVVATSGSAQAQTAGQPFGAPLVATVTDAAGNPVAGQPVTFSVASGPATFPGGASAATVTTTASGTATSPALTAGRANGSVTVTASAGSATPATFTAMVLATSASRADLQVSLTAPASVPRKGSFTATVKLKNAGPNAATNLLTVVGPGRNLTIVTATGGTVRRGSALFVASSLASGATLTYTVKFEVGNRADSRTGVAAASLSAIRDPSLSSNLAWTGVRII